MIYSLGDKKVVKKGKCFIADSADVIGDVEIGDRASIWFNVVIRADNDKVIIGDDTNIQDCSVLHVDEGSPLHIGKGVVVGHKVMLHGCTIGDDTLIGMNAVILDGARIGKGCLIGANTLIPEGKEIPDGSLVIGSPGRVKRQLTEKEQAGIREGAEHYVNKSRLFQDQLKPQKG